MTFSSTLLTLVMTWPVAAHMQSHLVGDGIDVWIFQWDNWWLLTALQEGLDPWFTPYLFYPHGVSLAYHSFSWVNWILWLPLQALVGSIAAYNVTVLLTFILAAVGMYYLTFDVTGSRPAAALAGMVYAFAPYHTWESLNHPNLATIQWLPFGLLFLRRMVRTRKYRAAGLTGIFLGLSGLAGAHMLLFTFFLAALWLVVHAFPHPLQYARGMWRPTLLVVGVVALMTLPLTFPVVRNLVRAGALNEALLQDSVLQPDVLEFFVPSRLLLLGRWLFPVQPDIIDHYTIYVGMIPLSLGIVGAILDRRRGGVWLASALLWALLALGSRLQVGGTVVQGVALPYGWLDDSLIGGIVRESFRFNILVGFSIAVAAGLGWAALTRRVRRRTLLLGLTVCVAGLILLEYAVWPFPTVQREVSPYFTSHRREGAVLTLPPGRQNVKFAMYDQTFHELPLVEGMVARTPATAYTFLNSIPMIQRSRGSRVQYGPAPEVTTVSRQLDMLNWMGVEHVILYKELMWPEVLMEWREFFTVEPIYEDEQIVVYTTEPLLGREYHLSYTFPRGVGLIRATVSRREIVQGEAVWLDVRWGAAREPESGLEAELRVLGDEEELVHVQDWPAPEGRIDIASQPLSLSPFVRPGTYRLQLVLRDADGNTLGSVLLPSRLTVQARERRFDAPLLAQEDVVDFGTHIRLRSYALDREGGEIRFQFQALRRMETDYKLFVHLLDSEGVVLDQWDGMPHDWSYPTSWWEAGEIVHDSVLLETALAEGNRLRIGWYDPLTGERLPTSTGEQFLVVPLYP